MTAYGKVFGTVTVDPQVSAYCLSYTRFAVPGAVFGART